MIGINEEEVQRRNHTIIIEPSKSGKSTSTSKSKSISMSDNDSRKSSTGIIASSESSSRASSPNTSRGGDVDDDDDDNKSIHSEVVEYKDVELAPLTPKNKDDDADTAADESGLLVDPHKNRNTSEWISFIVKKNGKVLSTCLSYSFCSVSMVLVNKSLASRYVTSDRGWLTALIALIALHLLIILLCTKLTSLSNVFPPILILLVIII